jgi:ABC-2 type transport system permease protein
VTGTPSDFGVTVEKSLSPQLRGTFQLLARQLALNEQVINLGGDPAQVGVAVEGATFAVRPLEPEIPYQVERLVLGLIAGVLVYLALMLYGQFVAQGVVEEKSSRIVELLLTTIKPWQLMLGKVAGIGAVGLAQLLLLSVVGVGAGLALDVIDFPASIAATAAAWTVVWFLLGFAVSR